MIKFDSLKGAWKTIINKNITNTHVDETILLSLQTKLKDHSFRFNSRPLDDKIVLESMLIVLEEIYDKQNLCTTHSALKQVTRWYGTQYFIKGQLDSSIDKNSLVKLLDKQIHDREFIDIILKGLNCNSIDLSNPSCTRDISSIISNSYLHEFDNWFLNQFGRRIYYVRYRGEFLIGINGTYDFALKVQCEVSTFFKEKLLNSELTSVRTSFLFADIKMCRTGQNYTKVLSLPRRGSTRLIALAPIQDLVELLRDHGFCRIKNFSRRDVIPTRKAPWLNLPIHDIIEKYNFIWIGLLSYYSFAYNRSQLNFIQFLLEHSLACTLMNKLKLNSRAQVFKKFGRPIKYSFYPQDSKQPQIVRFKSFKTLVRLNKFNNFQQISPYFKHLTRGDRWKWRNY
jgi:hypothetical protein